MKSALGLIVLISFIYHTQTDEDFEIPCNLVILDAGTLKISPLGKCLAESVKVGEEPATVTSSQYICNAENSAVEFKEYDNVDCSGEATMSEVITTDETLFKCDGDGCPVFEWRAYSASAGGEGDVKCTKSPDNFVEGAVMVWYCVAGLKADCTLEEGTGKGDLRLHYYWEGDNLLARGLDALNVFDSDHKMKANCSTEIQHTDILHTSGCTQILFNWVYTEVMACGAPCQYSLFLLYVVVLVVSAFVH